MDAHKLWMLRDFIGTNKVLFRIPVYQRNYDWSEANCDRLLDDIYEIINSGDKHFLIHRRPSWTNSGTMQKSMVPLSTETRTTQYESINCCNELEF